MPSSSIDWDVRNGLNEIPIEERNPDEVRKVFGKLDDGNLANVLICPENTPASNYGFDVTPARFVTALITEKGICEAAEEGLLQLFPAYK